MQSGRGNLPRGSLRAVKALVQRVSEADVTVAGEIVGAIGPGILALVGVTHDDGPDQAAKVATKIAGTPDL